MPRQPCRAGGVGLGHENFAFPLALASRTRVSTERHLAPASPGLIVAIRSNRCQIRRCSATRSRRANLGSMAEMEYFCTHSAHDPESLTRHMNKMARDGWDLVTVDFAIRGETGYHTFFWRRPLGDPADASQQAV